MAKLCTPAEDREKEGSTRPGNTLRTHGTLYLDAGPIALSWVAGSFYRLWRWETLVLWGFPVCEDTLRPEHESALDKLVGRACHEAPPRGIRDDGSTDGTVPLYEPLDLEEAPFTVAMNEDGRSLSELRGSLRWPDLVKKQIFHPSMKERWRDWVFDWRRDALPLEASARPEEVERLDVSYVVPIEPQPDLRLYLGRRGFMVIGRASETGSEETNRKVSKARARSVERALERKLREQGSDEERHWVDRAWMGEEDPLLAVEDGEKRRVAQNRSVVVMALYAHDCVVLDRPADLEDRLRTQMQNIAGAARSDLPRGKSRYELRRFVKEDYILGMNAWKLVTEHREPRVPIRGGYSWRSRKFELPGVTMPMWEILERGEREGHATAKGDFGTPSQRYSSAGDQLDTLVVGQGDRGSMNPASLKKEVAATDNPQSKIANGIQLECGEHVAFARSFNLVLEDYDALAGVALYGFDEATASKAAAIEAESFGDGHVSVQFPGDELVKP